MKDLTFEDTQALLKVGFPADLAERSDFTFLARAIYSQACGHPYLTQYLADMILKTIRTGGTVSSDADLQKQADQWFESSYFFNHLCDTLKFYKLDHDCSALLDRNPKQIVISWSAFQNLQLVGAASLEENRHDARNPLLERGLRKWLQSNPPQAPAHWQPGDRREVEDLLHDIPPIHDDELKHLTARLIEHNLLQSDASIRATFIRAGLQKLLTSFDAKGAMTTVVPLLVYFLLTQGRFEDGNHPLGMLLSDLQSFSADKQEFESLINRYGLLPKRVD